MAVAGGGGGGWLIVAYLLGVEEMRLNLSQIKVEAE